MMPQASVRWRRGSHAWNQSAGNVAKIIGQDLVAGAPRDNLKTQSFFRLGLTFHICLGGAAKEVLLKMIFLFFFFFFSFSVVFIIL